MTQAALPPASVPFVDKNGIITPDWYQALTNILDRTGGTAVDKVDVAATTASAAGEAAGDAQDAADAAAASAAAAQASADAALSANTGIALSASYVTGCTIAGHDSGGGSADIVISGHTRVYGDGTSVSVDGNTLNGRAYASPFYIYYDDATRAGGAVSYMTDSSYSSASYSAAHPNRHFVGAVQTPALGDPDTDGHAAETPGYVGP